MKTTHLTEEQLVAHYYGESKSEAEAHLRECAECRGELRALEQVLAVAEAEPAPERGEEYGAQVWTRIRARLPEHAPKHAWGGLFIKFPRWTWAPVAAMLIVGAFFLGYYLRQTPPMVDEPGRGVAAIRQHVILVALGDHIDRSQMVLLELTNATDASGDQERVRDLLADNRLYRQTALENEDRATAAVLEELERILLEVANSPEGLSGPALERIQARIQGQGILFKVRVVGERVRAKEQQTAARTMFDSL
jgi:hypothetical protein